MNPSTIKNDIVKMLNDIANRTNYINYHHPDRDMSLDIDLVKDDLRTLYRSFDILKSIPRNQAFSSETDEMPGDKTVQYKPGETGSSAEADERKEGAIPGATSIDEKPSQETLPDAVELQEEQPEEENVGLTIDDKPVPEKTQPAHTDRCCDEEDAKATEIKHSGLIQETVQEEISEPKAEAEAEAKTVTVTEANTESSQKASTAGNGKKSVIDLLSSYSQKTIGDQYAQADNSLNKRISGDLADNSIGAKMQLNPISNIKDVIGLNEKFLFINELFSGNIQEYHDAIARLNTKENMQLAFEYLNQLSEKHSWDAERSTATINKLATYVQRRYM